MFRDRATRHAMPMLLLLAACKPAAAPAEPSAAAATAPDSPPAEAAPSVQEIVADSALPQTLAAPLPGDPMAVTVHRLSNGMTVYISTDRKEPRFAAWVGVRAGSRMDPAESTGLAHYLEHMLFKGTDDFGTVDAAAEKRHVERIEALYRELRSVTDPDHRAVLLQQIDQETQAMARYAVPNEIDRMYSELGVRGVNAFTSFEETVYVGDIPSPRLAPWATVEAERFADPVFRLFYPELEAVYEEKNLSIDDPSRRVWEALLRGVFGQHPYGSQTTLGSVEHLKTPAYQDMVDYFDRWYVPNNMAIALAGDIDPQVALPVLEETFGRLRPEPLPSLPSARLDPPRGREVHEVQGEGAESITLAWPTVALTHEDEPALLVMDRLLDDISVGLLNTELELTQKVPEVGSWNHQLNEGGYYAIRATAREGQSLDEIEQMILQTVAKLKGGAVTPADVEAVKVQHEVHRKRELEDNWARAGEMMDAFVGRRDWADVLAREERIAQVRPDDVLRVANTYLGQDYVVVRKTKGQPEIPKLDKPQITPVAIVADRKSAFAEQIAAMPTPALEPEWLVAGEDYDERSLPAGPLIAARNTRNDLFSLTYRFERGYREAPLLCYALELFDLAGSGSTSAEAVKKELYRLGSTVSTECDAEFSTLTVSGLDEHLEPTLALVRAWLADPSFDRDTVRKHLDNTLSRRRDLMERDESLTSALDLFAKYARASAWLRLPSNAALRRAKPAELRRLITTWMGFRHQTHYYGPRTAADVANVVAHPGARFRPTQPVWTRRYRSVSEPTLYFLHKDGAKANVRFVMPRQPVSRDERAVAELLGEYLGGGMSSLVFQEIREARGLAYRAHAQVSPGARPDDAAGLLGTLSTQADKTPVAVQTLLELVRREQLEPARLETARHALDQEYRSSRIDPRSITWWVQRWRERGETEDPRPFEWKTILGVPADRVEQLATSFRSDPPILAVIGDRERVGLAELAKLGRVVEVEPADLFGFGAFPEAEDSEPAK